MIFFFPEETTFLTLEFLAQRIHFFPLSHSIYLLIFFRNVLLQSISENPEK